MHVIRGWYDGTKSCWTVSNMELYISNYSDLVRATLKREAHSLRTFLRALGVDEASKLVLLVLRQAWSFKNASIRHETL